MGDELKPCHFRQVDNHGRILCNVIKGSDREVSVQLCRVCPVSQINCQNLRAGLEKKISTPLTVRFATGRVEVWDDAPPTIEFKQAACAAKTMPIHSPRDCAGCPIRIPNIIPQNAIQVAHRAKQNAPAVAQSFAPARDNNVVAAQPVAQSQPRAHRSPTRTAQPAAQNLSHPTAQAQTPAPPTPQLPTGIDVGAANDLIARAKATAARKAEEKHQAELARAAHENQAQSAAPQPEAKSKIIQMKEWLEGQVQKKQNAAARNNFYKPQEMMPDPDGVSEIVYAPLSAQATAAYQEIVDYERCVGWTD